jgi:hypothetical protein
MWPAGVQIPECALHLHAASGQTHLNFRNILKINDQVFDGNVF